MLKGLTVWFLILAIFVTNCSIVFVYAGFKFNQPYITQNFCVNRFNPSLHCNGKCYFMRKMRQADEREKKRSAKGNSSRIEITVFQEPTSIAFVKPVMANKAIYSFRLFAYMYISHYLNSIFRPPKSLV